MVEFVTLFVFKNVYKEGFDIKMPVVVLNLVRYGVKVSVKGDYWIQILENGRILLIEQYFETNLNATLQQANEINTYISSSFLYYKGEHVVMNWDKLDKDIEGREYILMRPYESYQLGGENKEIKVEEME